MGSIRLPESSYVRPPGLAPDAKVTPGVFAFTRATGAFLFCEDAETDAEAASLARVWRLLEAHGPATDTRYAWLSADGAVYELTDD